MPTTKTPTKSKATRKTSKEVDSIRVRMYCHGFGDCFLLTFLSKEKPIYRMLVDCGMLTGDTEVLKRVIKNIKEDCDAHLDLVVQTHEHKDHISGFNLRDNDDTLLWDDINVENVWLAWTENTGPNGDVFAKQLKEKTNMKKRALAQALALFNRNIDDTEHKQMLSAEYKGKQYLAAQERYAIALQQLLNFNGIDEEAIKELENFQMEGGSDMALEALSLRMKDAMEYFINRSKDDTIEENKRPGINFCSPGEVFDSKTTGLEGVKFYILGPPKDYKRLRQMEDNQHVEMYFTEFGFSDNFYMALDREPSNNRGHSLPFDADPDEVNANNGNQLSPFNKKYIATEKERINSKHEVDSVWNLYKNEKWRQIEIDWLYNAGALALNLDSYTNNTSLAFAIELEESEQVLLFPGDAQIGNWLSWTEPIEEGKETPKLKWEINSNGQEKTVTAEDLLKRTVFYKVAHHASHNATARKHGLELMNDSRLVAMIPVDEKVARKQGKRGWKMPADNLYKRLQQKTKGRIIRLDLGNLLKDGADHLQGNAKPTKKQQDAFNSKVSYSKDKVTTSDGRIRPLYYEYTIDDVD